METGPKTGELSRTAVGSCRGAAEPRRGTGYTTVCYVENSEHATSRMCVGSRHGSHSDSGRLLQKATGPGWLLGLSLLDWAASIWVAGRFDWTVGLVSSRFS